MASHSETESDMHHTSARRWDLPASVARWWDWFAIGLLMILTVLLAPFAGASADTARDAYQAWLIAQGVQLPLQGPVFAGTFHAGPVWFYVLALPLLISTSWTALMVWISLLVALQFPLAYWAGRSWAGRGFGLMFAAILAVPGWHSISALAPSHTALTPLLTVAWLALMHRWWRRQNVLRAALVGVMAGLAFHAHPTAVALILASGLLACWVQRKNLWQCLGTLMVLGVAFVLPFLPWLWQQAVTGWSDFGAAQQSMQSLNAIAVLQQFPSLLTGVVFQGPWFFWHHLTTIPVLLASGLSIITIGLIVAGILLALVRVRISGAMPAVWLVLLLVLLCAWMLKSAVAHYMLYALWTCLALLIALGIGHWNSRLRNSVLAGVYLLAISALLAQGQFMRMSAENGNLTFPRDVIMNIGRIPIGATVARAHAAVGSRDAIAAWLCQHSSPVVVLGPAYTVLDDSAGVELNLHCQRRVTVLHQPMDGASALVGASRKLWQQVQADSPRTTTGSYAWQEPVWVAPAKQKTAPLVDVQSYPPRRPRSAAFAIRHERGIPFAQGDRLWVFNPLDLWFSWTQLPQAFCAGTDLALSPIVRQPMLVVYAPECRQGRVVIRGPEVGYTQVFLTADDATIGPHFEE